MGVVTGLDTDADAAGTRQADAAPAMVDLAFAVEGRTVPAAYRVALSDAVLGCLPWLADLPAAGIHRLNLAHGAAAQGLLSGRTRLVLRLPRGRAADAAALERRTLVLEGHALRLGAAQPRELLPWGTLYAHLVATEHADERAFLAEVGAGLEGLGVACRVIAGRRHDWDAGAVQGYALMLDGLSAADAIRVQEAGIGAHRRLGCGVFVPHKSAAAVGTPH